MEDGELRWKMLMLLEDMALLVGPGHSMRRL